MSFHFDTPIERRGSGSYKWDSVASDSLPMWVADMDFQTAPAVIEALQRRVAHGVFGYSQVPDAYYNALLDWQARRHNFTIERDWVLYTSGVVPAISAILRALTHPGDRVVVQSPVYNCFYSSIRNLGCQVVENELRNRDGHYEMDYQALEQQLAHPDVHVLLLCNPHNPVGRAWRTEELTRLGELCLRYDVVVVSDEIHSDLVFPGEFHQPFATIDPHFLRASVTCSSPSKAFNIAGLQIANIIVSDPALRTRINKALNVHEVCDVNPLGIEALIAAYSQGEAWLDALRTYLHGNYQHTQAFLEQAIPRLQLTHQEATYLAWIDCRALSASSAEISQRLATQGQLLINEGTLYGSTGEGYIRLNLACPRSVLEDGLQRLQSVLG